MTTVVLAHPHEHCPRFQVFGVYDGPREHRTFGVQEFDIRNDAERVARKLMEEHEAEIISGGSFTTARRSAEVAPKANGSGGHLAGLFALAMLMGATVMPYNAP